MGSRKEKILPCEAALSHMTETLKREEHWGRCELLVLSSLLFLTPLAFTDWQHRLSICLALLSVVTAFNSVMLWADPQNVAKWKIDKLTARVSAFIYTCVGVSVMSMTFFLNVGVPTWIGMGASYLTSRKLDRKHDPKWIYAHGIFHAMVAIGMCEVMINC
mmetsp:Transcript_46037/g.73514  ORF Transcript_46037/g.73514 Transcript_46037/m.73514 type:complete len:161 (+) Transcript_46037:3-485(+)